MKKRRLTFKLTAGAGVAVLSTVSLLAFPGRAAAGTFPGANGRLMYTDIDGPAYHFSSIKADGTDPKTVIADSVSKSDVEYSPDGTKITYVDNVSSTDQVFTANADGSNRQQLTSSAGHNYTPSWSPDGSKIVFVQSVSGNKRIFTMNSDGTNQAVLNITSPFSDPEYSPDGSKIVAVLEGSDYEIAIVSADGGSINTITSNSVHDYKASWSPDGTKLIYSSVVSGSPELFTMNPDGTNKTQLTSAGVGYHHPEYSPDGTKITFIDNLAPSAVYVANADATNITQLDAGWAREVSWQPLTIKPSSSTPNPTISVSGGKATVNIAAMYTDAYEGIDKATVAVTSTPSAGTTSVDTTTGVVTYTPKTTTASRSLLNTVASVFFPKVSAAGTDSFTYQVCSQANSSFCSTGTVTVNLLGVPNTGAAPTATTNYLAWAVTSISVAGLLLAIRKLRRHYQA